MKLNPFFSFLLNIIESNELARGSMKPGHSIKKLELDLLLLYYTFSDQYGVVDTQRAQKWAKEHVGIHIPSSPFTITQEHVDLLIGARMIPDVLPLLNKFRTFKN